MNHVFSKILQAELVKRGGNRERAEQATRERGARFLKTNIFGIDINPNLVKAAKMNMVMNNDGTGGLYQGNSLASQATWSPEIRPLLGKVEALMTNPPFGSKIPIDDPAILDAYDLGHVWTYVPDDDRWIKTDGVQKSQPPEILFIERCVRFLRPGTGRAAMVLPDGILGSPGLGYVRQWLLSQTRILASIDMHPDMFQPNTSVQTSIVIFERKSPAEVALEEAAGHQSDYGVFMALGNHIGHDKRGYETYVRDAEGNEIVEEVEEETREYEDGQRVYRLHTTLRKVPDDNTKQIAEAFHVWLPSTLD